MLEVVWELFLLCTLQSSPAPLSASTRTNRGQKGEEETSGGGGIYSPYPTIEDLSDLVMFQVVMGETEGAGDGH